MRQKIIGIAWIVGSLLVWWLGMAICARNLLSTIDELYNYEQTIRVVGYINLVRGSGTLIVLSLVTFLVLTGQLPGTRKRGKPPYKYSFLSRFYWSAGSMTLFVFACMLPACQEIATCITGGEGTQYKKCDIWGYMALVIGLTYLPWWANPFWVLGNLLLLLRRYRLAAWFALGAVILASSVWVYPFLPGKYLGRIERLYIGANLWWASTVVLLAGSLLNLWRIHKAEATSP